MPACLKTNVPDESPEVKLIMSGWGNNSPKRKPIQSVEFI